MILSCHLICLVNDSNNVLCSPVCQSAEKDGLPAHWPWHHLQANTGHFQFIKSRKLGQDMKFYYTQRPNSFTDFSDLRKPKLLEIIVIL